THEGSGKVSGDRSHRETFRELVNGNILRSNRRMPIRWPQKLGRVSCAIVLAALIGCRSDAPYVVPEEPMPANTVMLAEMMRQLSATPGFTEAILAELDKSGKQGPALMTPAL